MSDLAVEVDCVWKKFRRGEIHDSLRDLIPALAGRLLRRGRRRAELAAEEFWALRDVEFQVRWGEVLEIVGANGAGKSTLLKVLSRILKPDRGRMAVHGRLRALIEIAAGFHGHLTGRENIYLNGTLMGMKKREIDRKFEAIVDFAGIEPFLETPVKRYNSGMYARLGFAVAAHLDPEILVVDEVLAVGDAAFQKKCLGRMHQTAEEGRTVLFVSHQWLPEKLTRQWQVFRDHPQVGVVHTEVINYDDQTGRTYHRERHRHKYVGRCYVQLFWDCAINQPSALIRRRCLDQVGLLDQSLKTSSSQDYDLWLRPARHVDFAFLDAPLLIYRQHPGNCSKREVVQAKADLYVIRKALRDDPSLRRLVGRWAARRRLATPLFRLGYLYFDRASHRTARYYFGKTLGQCPWDVYAGALWLAALLPPDWVRGLRSVKREAAAASKSVLALGARPRRGGSGGPAAPSSPPQAGADPFMTPSSGHGIAK